MNRDLDLEVVKNIFDWKPCPVGPDYDGKNAGVVYTSNGDLPEGYVLPARGKLHEGFMSPTYSDNIELAFELAQHVKLPTPISELPNDAEEITRICLDYYLKNN